MEMVVDMYEAGHLDANARICPDFGRNIKLLIVITSAPSHENARFAVRKTWGHFAIRNDIAFAFILGTTLNESYAEEIEMEQRIFGDLILGKFLDTYDNLTLKTISMLEWTSNYCPNAAFILKTDDDMFINVGRLIDLIETLQPEQKAIYGRLARKWKPIRNKQSKYYVSPKNYKPAVYPDFTTGPAYLFPVHLVRELYLAALNQTYMKLEDVFLTGNVAENLGIERINIPEFVNDQVSFTPCKIQAMISIHMVTSEQQYELWKKLHDLAECG